MSAADIEDVSRRLDALAMDHELFAGGDESSGDFIGITHSGVTRTFAWSDRYGWTMTQQGDRAIYQLEVLEPDKALAVTHAIVGVVTGKVRDFRTVAGSR